VFSNLFFDLIIRSIKKVIVNIYQIIYSWVLNFKKGKFFLRKFLPCFIERHKRVMNCCIVGAF